jgi:hypothetical protein
MTPKYWAGIVAAMLVIFGAGMLVARGIDKGKDLVFSTINTFPSAVPLMMSAGFKLDGSRVGEIQRLQFMRSQPGRVDSAVLTVKMSAPSDIRHAEGCLLRVTSGRPFGSNTRFVCTSSADSASLELVPFGHITLLPDGKDVPLYVAASVEDDIREHAYRGSGSSDSGDVDISAADGSFSIKVNGKELVTASGDSAGGSLVIRDPKTGRTILQISGDSNGGSIKVTDADGKTRVNIHGAGPKKDSTH